MIFTNEGKYATLVQLAEHFKYILLIHDLDTEVQV